MDEIERDRPPPRGEQLAGEGRRSRRMALAAALSGFRDPVILILLMAGVFDGLSGNPIHSILLFGVALALARDAALHRRAELVAPSAILPSPGEGRASSAALRAKELVAPAGTGASHLVFLGLSAVVYAAILGSFGRYSWPATTAVVVPGGVAIAIAWQGPRDERRGPRGLDSVGAFAWAAVFVALSLWELAALLLQPSLKTDSYAHPTLSVVTDAILASYPGRSIVLFLWLAFGWFLLQR